MDEEECVGGMLTNF
jgi:hypothetical protein